MSGQRSAINPMPNGRTNRYRPRPLDVMAMLVSMVEAAQLGIRFDSSCRRGATSSNCPVTSAAAPEENHILPHELWRSIESPSEPGKGVG